MNFNLKTAMPLLITFLTLSVIIVAASFLLTDKGIDYRVVMGANGLFFVISLLVFRMQYRALFNSNPHVFVRSVMGGTMLKIVGCMIAIIAYYLISRPAFNKPAVYMSMLIYIVYLVVEVRAIMKLNKPKNG